MIVAVNKNGIIGKNNRLLWKIPEDMKHFQRLTIHNVIVMGRKTYESLPTGPLQSRINIVITSTPNKYKINDCVAIFCDLDECEEIITKIQTKIQTNTNKKVFIIGGAEIYKYFFSKCTKIYVTHVETDETAGVSIAPLLHELHDKYDIIERTAPSTTNNIKYEFVTYKLRNSEV
jgi:dihydrofolate reductase